MMPKVIALLAVNLWMLPWNQSRIHSVGMTDSGITNLEQAGMILHALKNLLRERQAVHGRGGYPTDSDWVAIDRAIAATGFKVDEPVARAGSDGWQSTLESALRRSA